MKIILKTVIKKIYRLFAKTETAARLLRWYIIRKYTKMNRASSFDTVAKTPWVCEFPYDKDRCVAYINMEFSDYFSNSGLSVNQIIGKEILEIGPGENLGVALRLIAAGAKKVVCTDKFNSLIDENRQTEIYKQLLAILPADERDRLKNVISFTKGKAHINSEYVHYLNVSVEKLNSFFPPQHFDFIISRAVLEHVFFIEPAMETMDSLLKQNGYMLHEVDFRDHGVFTNYKLSPLAFLSVDDKKWLNMTSNLGAPNRKMLGYFQTFFKNKSYALETLYLRLFYSDDVTRRLKSLSDVTLDYKKMALDRNKIHSTCTINGDEDLVVAAAFFCAKKLKKN